MQISPGMASPLLFTRPRFRNTILSLAKPFCCPYASHIASDSSRAAIRADLSSANAFVQLTTLPPPSARIAPGAPLTRTEPFGATVKHPDSPRFFFRHCSNMPLGTCISTAVFAAPVPVILTTFSTAAAVVASARQNPNAIVLIFSSSCYCVC